MDGLTVLSLFEEQVRKQPLKTAVKFDNKQLTFSELHAEATSLAQVLQKKSIKEDMSVGIFVEPSIALVVGIWGVLQARAAYLPLSPDYPAERIKYMIDDSAISVIVTQKKFKKKLEILGISTIKLVVIDALMETGTDENNGHSIVIKQPLAQHLAYVIYTSGSTGKPKGVMISQQAIANQMLWLMQASHLESDDIVLQKTPISFDAAQWELLALCSGATVVMGASGIYKNPKAIVHTIQSQQVSLLQCVPTLLQALLDTDGFQDLHSLRKIFSGGEVLTQKLAYRCLKQMPFCRLTNLYGPTECTINSSAIIVCQKDIETYPESIGIGTPIRNMCYLVLDEKLEPCAPNEVGELYIGGIGVAQGYLHKPDLTKARFIQNPFNDSNYPVLYKTGDLMKRSLQGDVYYVGRVDNQIKLRGYRIELEEISALISKHHWVKHVATIVRPDDVAKLKKIISFVELDAKEAPLMDQGRHIEHHQSKLNKAQVKLQLSNKGVREPEQCAGKIIVSLPRRVASQKQIFTAFSRKTYRFFDGGDAHLEELLSLLSSKKKCADPLDLQQLKFEDLSEILRYFGQFKSDERLLPKYAYASPGALNPTQLYLEITGYQQLSAGYYYYHPIEHKLVLIQHITDQPRVKVKLHYVGKKSAIEPIYKNNLQEVLEMEVGHMVGLFEHILTDYGLTIQVDTYDVSLLNAFEVNAEDIYLGSFQLQSGHFPKMKNPVVFYVQSHGEHIAELPKGTYQYYLGKLSKVSDEMIEKKSVIAINQAVYEGAALGISMVLASSDGWLDYIHLGRALQTLQMNSLCFGFMSSGYSSKTGNDLPTAIRLKEILGVEVVASYFCVGGKISQKQLYSQDMSEDLVHMKGPAELIAEDLIKFLPDYMMPSKIFIVNEMPLAPNGKVDLQKLQSMVKSHDYQQELVTPRTKYEEKLTSVWCNVMKLQRASVLANFFELGGNSLIALSLIDQVNREFKINLPLQFLFKYPTIEQMAARLYDHEEKIPSNLLPLQEMGEGQPIYCWPGLGGCVLNLRLLAEFFGREQPFYGVQIQGINDHELPHSTIQEMAAADITLLQQLQPHGPYRLWGYSFGARVAFEVAYLLELQGETVSELIMIAPGMPATSHKQWSLDHQDNLYADKKFVAVLFSVFMTQIKGPLLDRCLEEVYDEQSFINFIATHVPYFSRAVIKRIIDIAYSCYRFRYTEFALRERQIKAPVIYIKAQSDMASFFENTDKFHSQTCVVLKSHYEHYDMLKETGVRDLIALIRQAITALEIKETMN